jgi:predicted aspartyl protease
MGVIRQELLVRGDGGRKRLTVLFDSGAARSLIRSDIAAELSTPRKLLISRELVAADGDKVACDSFCDLVIEIEGKEIGIEAFLVDKLPVPLIFGALDMEAYRIKLNLAERRLDLSEFTGYMLAV